MDISESNADLIKTIASLCEIGRKHGLLAVSTKIEEEKIAMSPLMKRAVEMIVNGHELTQVFYVLKAGFEEQLIALKREQRIMRSAAQFIAESRTKRQASEQLSWIAARV
jgi:flagellar motor component MotA